MQTLSNTSKPLADGNAQDAMQSVMSTANSVQSGVSREFHSFIADIEDLVKQTTSLTGDDLEHAKDQLVKRIATAKESIEDVGSDIVNQARKSVAATNEYVHDQPWNAIGAGAVAGMLIGFLLARRG
jgi:ElaB/YqjD/DUF883 family membrane-anchored ribosome-binding protein